MVRIELKRGASDGLIRQIQRGVRAASEQVYTVDAPLGLAGVLQLAKLDRSELRDTPWHPVTPRRLAIERAKVNALVDEAVTDELYAASQTGADIEIVTHEICCPRPGVHGLSEGISVRSVLGGSSSTAACTSSRPASAARTWLGSADLMPRNLDRRIEVLAPVDDPRLRRRLDDVFDALVADNLQSWSLDADGHWSRNEPVFDGQPVVAQDVLMRSASKRARKKH